MAPLSLYSLDEFSLGAQAYLSGASVTKQKETLIRRSPTARRSRRSWWRRDVRRRRSSGGQSLPSLSSCPFWTSGLELKEEPKELYLAYDNYKQRLVLTRINWYKKRLFPDQVQIYYWSLFCRTHEHYNS